MRIHGCIGCQLAYAGAITSCIRIYRCETRVGALL
jgi:hypothetical protein